VAPRKYASIKRDGNAAEHSCLYGGAQSPQFDLDDAECLITNLSKLSDDAKHTTTRVRQFFEGVSVLLSDSVDPPVPESVEPPVPEISHDSDD
jgi:hypothetical protein